jgi:hypothetical protein
MKTKRFSDRGGLTVIAAFLIFLTAACHGRHTRSLGGLQVAAFAGQSLSLSAKMQEAANAADVPSVHPNQESFTSNISPLPAND